MGSVLEFLILVWSGICVPVQGSGWTLGFVSEIQVLCLGCCVQFMRFRFEFVVWDLCIRSDFCALGSTAWASMDLGVNC